MSQKERIVIIGATSAIATHCARLWVQRGVVNMTLVGRDREKLERLAQDLRTRSPTSVITTQIGTFDNAAGIQETVNSINELDQLAIVLIAHGSLSDQLLCQADLTIAESELTINGVSPVLYAEAFAAKMLANNRGILAVIGSVAGDRGRKSNYVYGAAKGLVARYIQGLQHRLASSGVRVVLVKPGPTDTPMTASLKGQGMKLAPVEEVAAAIVSAIDKGMPTVYAPPKWWLIMMVIRHLPTFIFNKMNI